MGGVKNINDLFRDHSMYNGMKDPLVNYMSQASMYVAKSKNIPLDKATELVRKAIRKKGVTNPNIKYYDKNEVGDRIVVEDKLSNYIKEVVEANEIIAPSFTTYVHPSERKSIHAEFLQENITKRKQDKKAAFKYKQDNNPDKYLYFNTLQKTRKIFNNSLSGAYAAKGTILYNPSGHYTLTSTTRSVTSIGNAITESMVTSNKYYKDPDIVMNYITTIINNIDMDNLDNLITSYNIHQPTAIEVLEVIKFSTRKYWTSDKHESNILKYLSRLNKTELAAVLYVNDMNALRKYNDGLVKTFISKLASRLTHGSVDIMKDLNSAPEAISNLVAHICATDIKGMNVNYAEMVGTDTLLTLASTTKNVISVLLEYSWLIRTLFITDVMPPTIAYIKDMYRESIVLSDTDSTCGAYDNWVKWYFGDVIFTPEATAISAAVMTINTQAIDHYLQVLTAKMNIPEETRPLIAMKNEFYWDLFTSTNVSKHYFGNIRIQEGNVFAEPDLELKGVHLIASAVSKEIRDIGYDMINYIHETVASGGKISLNYMGKVTADLERKIIHDIKQGKSSIFKIDKIKEENSYKLDKLRSPYIHHMLWTDVFSEKYGNPGDPTYMVINVPTIIKSKRILSEYLAGIVDVDIRDKLSEFMSKYNKESLGTFRVPLNIVSGKSLPEEIYQAVDIHKVVTNNCNLLYLVLESCGLYRKNSLLFSEMGY